LSFDRYIREDVFLKLPSIEKPEALLRAVVLSNESDGAKLGLTPIALPDLEQEIRRSSLEDIVATRRKSALDLTSFRQTQIEGNVTLEQKAVLILQTPFDRGWEAWQDGKAAPVVKVDVGLLGVGLDSGQHKVELRYQTPFLRLGLAIALGSLLVLTFTAWRWPRLRLVDQSSSVSPVA
ncbi:MAG TPA: YfhO family protein, partial [Chthoniobacterales bacterium]